VSNSTTLNVRYSAVSFMFFDKFKINGFSRTRTLSAGLLATTLLVSAPYLAKAAVDPAIAPQEEKIPVDMNAGTLIYDEKKQLVTASEDVEFIYGDRILRAQTVTYDLETEIVEAVGEVVILEPNGDVHFAESIELSRDLGDGFVKKLRSVLSDGSRVKASEGQRIGARETIMRKAVYTACEPCKKNPEKAPVWQIKAREVVHDNVDKSIVYDDATFEVYGTPVLYTPYFRHSDGTVDRQSGWLAPSLSFSSEQGFGVENSYYFDIAPDLDATLGARVFAQQNPLLLGEVRKRFDKAAVEFQGGITYAERDDSVGGVTVRTDKEVRGHLFGEGLLEINEKWRTGFDVETVTDDQYAREYDITSDDVLENQLYAERFSGRDYAAIRSFYYQDVRVSERQRDQPLILPEIEASFYGEPNQFFGGQWQANFSGLGLNRLENGQETYRLSSDLGWYKRAVMPIGLVNTVDLNARTDVFYFDGRSADLDDNQARFFPTAHFESRYPLARQFEKSQMVIEPKVSLTLAPNLGDDSVDIPNEDSQDVQIDTVNLYNANRFPGYDRVEDISRFTYGVRTGIYDFKNNEAEIFLGQSLRLEEDGGLFSEGSGLEDNVSDIVGEVKAKFTPYVDLNYRFQFDGKDFSSKRHEVSSIFKGGPITLNTNYLYASAFNTTDIPDDREQVNSTLKLQLTPQWAARTGAVYDFSSRNEGLRRAQIGLDYTGQCVDVQTIMQRNFTQERTGENSTEFFVRLGLKNIIDIQDQQ